MPSSADFLVVATPTKVASLEPGTALRSLAHELLEELAARGGDVVKAVWQGMHALEPYAHLGAFEREEILSTLQSTFVTFVNCLAAGRSMTLDEVERLEKIGAARARQDIPLEIVARNFRIALRLAYRELLDVAKARGEPRVLDVIVELSVALTELMLDAGQAIQRGYSNEDEQRMTQRSRARRALVESVLDGMAGDAMLQTRAWEMGVSSAAPCALVVAVPRAGLAEDPHHVADALVSALPEAVAAPVRTLPVPHVVVLAMSWDHRGEQALSDIARQRGLRVVVAAADRLYDLGTAYRRLRPSVHLIDVVSDGPVVMPVAEFAFYEVIGASGPEAAEDFVRGAIGALLALPESRSTALLATVAALDGAGGHIATAAGTLHLHDRSVRHRLATIADLTSLDLRNARDLMTASLAVHLLRLHRSALPSLGDSAWSCPGAQGLTDPSMHGQAMPRSRRSAT